MINSLFPLFNKNLPFSAVEAAVKHLTTTSFVYRAFSSGFLMYLSLFLNITAFTTLIILSCFTLVNAIDPYVVQLIVNKLGFFHRFDYVFRGIELCLNVQLDIFRSNLAETAASLSNTLENFNEQIVNYDNVLHDAKRMCTTEPDAIKSLDKNINALKNNTETNLEALPIEVDPLKNRCEIYQKMFLEHQIKGLDTVPCKEALDICTIMNEND